MTAPVIRKSPLGHTSVERPSGGAENTSVPRECYRGGPRWTRSVITGGGSTCQPLSPAAPATAPRTHGQSGQEGRDRGGAQQHGHPFTKANLTTATSARPIPAETNREPPTGHPSPNGSHREGILGMSVHPGPGDRAQSHATPLLAGHATSLNPAAPQQQDSLGFLHSHWGAQQVHAALPPGLITTPPPEAHSSRTI